MAAENKQPSYDVIVFRRPIHDDATISAAGNPGQTNQSPLFFLGFVRAETNLHRLCGSPENPTSMAATCEMVATARSSESLRSIWPTEYHPIRELVPHARDSGEDASEAE
ncbi:hypothetical protein CHU98_g2816 [Xylaria longipes]|nr:hypothetical protein CHU98_g2816 [Xylaria longipes]